MSTFRELLNEDNKKLEQKILKELSKISKSISNVGIYPDDRLADVEVRYTASSSDDAYNEISKTISKVESVVRKNVSKVSWRADKKGYSMMSNDKGTHIGVLFKVTL